MTQRFTIDGSDQLEAQLLEHCVRARDGVLERIPARAIAALVLGGGYGRGEGGVLRENGEDRPYNDLEFYILLRGSELLASRRYGAAVHAFADELTRAAGVDVEFKLLGMRKLERSEPSMFYYDLVTGHRLLHGPENWTARCEHHRAAQRIPLHEATRLLMNRCSGLLFAEERLRRESFSAEDADFTGRNLAKAKLAFGDVVLTLRGQYHWSCLERHKRLKKMEPDKALSGLSSLVSLHEQGVEFKLRPVRTRRSQSELLHELKFLKETARELWLCLESRRLGRPFDAPCDYSFDRQSKCPESSALKNRLVNARTFGLSGLANSRYPRERLLNSLPLLLWDGTSNGFLQKQLGTEASAFPGLVSAYEAIWKHYN